MSQFAELRNKIGNLLSQDMKSESLLLTGLPAARALTIASKSIADFWMELELTGFFSKDCINDKLWSNYHVIQQMVKEYNSGGSIKVMWHYNFFVCYNL